MPTSSKGSQRSGPNTRRLFVVWCSHLLHLSWNWKQLSEPATRVKAWHRVEPWLIGAKEASLSNNLPSNWKWTLATLSSHFVVVVFTFLFLLLLLLTSSGGWLVLGRFCSKIALLCNAPIYARKTISIMLRPKPYLCSQYHILCSNNGAACVRRCVFVAFKKRKIYWTWLAWLIVKKYIIITMNFHSIMPAQLRWCHYSCLGFKIMRWHNSNSIVKNIYFDEFSPLCQHNRCCYMP